ncbi:hypothetical protein [Scytonema sp. NUACC26]|uniref:hypothetical protein n=1 Tax=Scytonema sp. NUACC26 TaxID=3140176 RepID=UPI0034DCB3B4
MQNNPSNFSGFEDEEVLLKEFATSKGSLEVAAEVSIEGKTLKLKNISIFPKDVRRLELSTREVLELKNQLVQEVKATGFDRLQITGKRVSRANLGKNVVDIDLTKI